MTLELNILLFDKVSSRRLNLKSLIRDSTKNYPRGTQLKVSPKGSNLKSYPMDST